MTTTNEAKAPQRTVNEKGIKSLVRHVLGYTEEQMFWTIHAEGMAYLKFQCAGDQWGIDMLSAEPFYWNWWTEQWRRRDHFFFQKYHVYAFAEDEMNDAQVRTMRKLYANLHLGEINSDLLDKQYSHIVTLMIRETNQKRVFTTI